MKTMLLGSSSLVTTRLSYGCMRISYGERGEPSPEVTRRGIAAVMAAYEAGYVLFDTADIYGKGASEIILGAALREHASLREEILIATKCGIRQTGDPTPRDVPRYDFSREHILRSCEGSLKRLGIETIDIYQLHRPDALMQPDEVVGAFDQLRREGKVREVGVSNFSPSQLALLQSRLPMRLQVNQVRISLNFLQCFEDGTLDQCLAEHITPLAWSPLDRGLLADGGKASADHPEAERINGLLQCLEAIAGERGVSRTHVALAWLLKHPAGIIPIVGSANPDHIVEAAEADQVELSREEWYRLYAAGRGRNVP